MAIKYPHASGSWSTLQWYDAASGGNTTSTPTGTDIADANGYNVTLDIDLTGGAAVAQLQANTGSFVIPASTARTITCNIYSNGNTTLFTLATGQTLTVNGTVTVGGGFSGVIFDGAGGTLNVTGTPAFYSSASNSNTGRFVYGRGMTSVVTGNCQQTHGNFYPRFFDITSGAATLHGNISGHETNQGGWRACYLTGGQFTLDGVIDVFGSSSNLAIDIAGGTFVWTGTQTLSAGQLTKILFESGTLNLSSLVLNNSGQVFIQHNGSGTLNLGAGDALHKIVNLTSTAQAVASGFSLNVIGPTLPDPTKVASGQANYGYSASLQTPSYPTTATTQAAQQAADAAIVSGSAASILASDSITIGANTITGTYTPAHALSTLLSGSLSSADLNATI